jgi:hypothetical protein
MIKLVGRDALLKREIYPRLKAGKAFCLVGQRGIGKTALLQWAYEQFQDDINPEDPAIFVNCSDTYSQIIKEIATAQRIEKTKKMTADLEKEILKGPKLTIFLDEIERATPKLIRLLKALNEVWCVYMAGIEPFKDEMKVLLWGKQKIRLIPVKQEFRTKLAQLCVSDTGSLVDANTIATSCRGVPGRAWAIARGEHVRHDDERVEGEEINIAPILILGICCLVILRYLAREAGERELYLLGSIGMGLAIFGRLLIYRMMRKT